MEDLLERVMQSPRPSAAPKFPLVRRRDRTRILTPPRAPTRDIDINVYLRVDDAGRALDSLQELGVRRLTTISGRRSNVTARHGCTGTRFPSTSSSGIWSFTRAVKRRRQYALLDHTIDVLSPEDLIVLQGRLRP